MSDRLKLAFAEAAKLSEEDQNAFADFILAELDDDRLWTEKFASSQDLLKSLADRARADHAQGKTRPLDELLP